MIEHIKAVVTETDENGVSVFRSSDVIEPVRVRTPVEGRKERTASLWPVWGTSDGVRGLDDAEAVFTPYPPGPGATRFSVFTMPPDSWATDLDSRDTEVSGDFLGIGDTHKDEPEDQAAFHATETIDYVFIAQGELEVELDAGRRERLTQGTCLVQRGTRHAWRNPTAEPALLVVVMVGVSTG
jgi:mannose-6-phosphate isomerase-like protein (cupin superfamily)